MTYEIVHLFRVPNEAIQEIMDEAQTAEEFINPLWRLYEVPSDGWKKTAVDSRTKGESLLAFLVNEKIVGVARVTVHPKHIENGKVGFYIRPSERNRKYAPSMIRMIEGWCEEQNISDITAVVDVKNMKSFKALYSAGWERSGKQYRWNQERTAIELKPKSSGS